MALFDRTFTPKVTPKMPPRPMVEGEVRANDEERSPDQADERMSVRMDGLLDLKFRVHERLVRELDPSKLNSGADRDRVRRSVEDAADGMIAQDNAHLTRTERARLASEVADEILGYGPIEPLLQDPTVTEVMVNGPDRVYFERDGVLQLSDRLFKDDAHIMRIIEKIVAPLGRRIDEASPMVDARLPDGSRVNAIIPPLSVHGPSVTIRKFAREPFTAEALVALGTMDHAILELLKACVAARLNIIISGGTGTGKTTFLNVLSSYISDRERLVTIEDPAELQIRQQNWVSLETRPPNIEGKGQVVQRDLVRNALRMRPDRIIVGECRAGEAFDMLQAMNTGHDGSMTTIHANTPRDAISRIEDMVLMASLDLPQRAIREQIASAIHLVVHLVRFRDGTRRITNLSEVVGMEGQVVTMHDVYLFHQTGVDDEDKIVGSFKPTGIRPHFIERIELAGITLPPEVFGGPPTTLAGAKGRETW